MKRRKVNLKLDKENKTHTQCTLKRHAVELCVEEPSPSLADSTLDLTVTYDYNMPAYVASGPVKSNNEIVQLFTIDESPHRLPKKRLSLTNLSESHDSPTKKKSRRMKGMGTSVSPEDLRRFEELAHQLVQSPGQELVHQLVQSPGQELVHQLVQSPGQELAHQLVECRGFLDLEVWSPGHDHQLGAKYGSLRSHGITENTSLSKDEEFEDIFTSEELSTLDYIMHSSLSPISVPPSPPPPPLPPFMQSSCSTAHSTCSAPPRCHLAPPPKYLATPPSYLAPQLIGDDSDEDHNFWTEAADMLDTGSLEEEEVVMSSTAASSPVMAVVLTDCSSVPLSSSQPPQPCSQEDIAHKRNKALEKLAARKHCKLKAT